MSHTSGPWAFDGVRVYAPAADEKVVIRRADGTDVEYGRGLIALVYAPPLSGERDANARLITAAPTLLHALKALRSLAEALDLGNQERAAIRDLISAALDEAEIREAEVAR